MFCKRNRIHSESTRSKMKVSRKYNLTLLGLCVPGLLCLFIFSYLPMAGIVIAFKDYVPLKGLFGSEWVGLKNFEFFFKSQDLFRTIRNTVLYSIEFLALDLILGVLIALLLYFMRSRIGVKVYHTIMLIPKFLSIVIVSFISYSFLSPSFGVLNQIITYFGKEPVAWYSHSQYWPWILTIVHIWMALGSGCLYYYAALTGIDPSLFEAAEIDGANTLQKTWYVAIPELVPIMILTTILGIGNLFSGDMGLFYQVPRQQGVLFETTDIINTYTYRGLLGGDMSRSAAVGLFQSVVGFVLVITTNTIVRKIRPENALY